jgi:cytochrome b subunit of formate dehydrogenase
MRNWLPNRVSRRGIPWEGFLAAGRAFFSGLAPGAPGRQRSDVMTVLLHWLLVGALITSLLTGLPITADDETAFWSRLFSPVYLQGAVSSWHTWSSLALLGVAIAYVAFLIRARLIKRVALDAARLRALTTASGRARWQSVNVAIYWAGFLLLAGLGSTGLLLYFPVGQVPHEFSATVHRVLAWGTLAYLIVHVLGQLAMGGMAQLLKIMTPRMAYGAAAGSAILASGVAVGAGYFVDKAATGTLTLAKVGRGEAPAIDGVFGDLIWRTAIPVTVRTTRGANLPGGEAPVTVRGLHDGESAFFLIEWPDTTRSQKHLPLVKTDAGWKVLQKEYHIEDEDDFYEDKFAVMLSRSGAIGGGATHLGSHPLPGKPGAFGGRGLHYTTDGSIADVWHWKSVRSGPLEQFDDNYFGPPLEPTEAQLAGKKRYTGGYTQDPKTAGGFIMNWTKFDTNVIEPKHLPKSPDVFARLGKVDLDPDSSDFTQWWMTLSETVPYSKEIDEQIPVGTVMPAVVVEKPFEGDRGDVRAIAKWKDGMWRMEVKRKLDTGSQYDLPIATGIYMWFAVFDHAQTRHSRHLHPLRIAVE